MQMLQAKAPLNPRQTWHVLAIRLIMRLSRLYQALLFLVQVNLSVQQEAETF